MKYLKPILSLLIIIGALAAVKIYFFPSPNKKNKAMTPSGPMVMKVDGYVAKHSSLENKVYATGSLIANEMIEVKPEVAGRLTYLNIPEGQIVQKGQLLARVNDADLQADLRRLEVQLKIAENREERAAKLRDISGLSVEEYEDALNSLNVLKADIEYVKTLIDKTEIRAPFSGQLGFRNVSDGSYISTSDVLTTLQQLQPIKLEFSIPERYASQTNVGNTISFEVDGLTERFDAKVYAIDPNINVASRSLLLRAKAENKRNLLRPGAFARVYLSTGVDDQAIMIPTQAVIPILKGQQVFKVVDGAAQPQRVTLGYRDADKVQVLDGLTAGDTVITTGILSLRPGSLVEIKSVKE